MPTQTTPTRIQNLGLRRILAGLAVAGLLGLLGGCGGSHNPNEAAFKAAEAAEDHAAVVEGEAAAAKEQAKARETQKREAKEAAATKKREAQEHREEAAREREEARHRQEEQARASAPQIVPDESGQRLDVAEEELEAHSWHFKVVGGGLFGVVVKSDWTVCETRPSGGSSVSGSTTIRLVVARACP
jgi:hypothetical protein